MKDKEIKQGVVDTPVDMTDAEYKQLIDATAKMVTESANNMRKAEGDAIRTYYAIGGTVSSLQKSSGEGIVASFAARLRQQVEKQDNNVTIEASTLYACGTLFNALSEKQLDELINIGMGWKYIRALTSSRYDTEVRNKAIDLLVEGSILPKQTPRVMESLANNEDVQAMIEHNEREQKPKDKKKPHEVVQSNIFNFRESIELDIKKHNKLFNALKKKIVELDSQSRANIDDDLSSLLAAMQGSVVTYKNLTQQLEGL